MGRHLRVATRLPALRRQGWGTGPATAGAGGPRETAALCGEVARPPPCPPPWKSRTWEGRSVTRMQHGADGTERDAGDQVVQERGGSFGRRGKNSTHAEGGVERSLEEGRPPQTARAPLRGGAWKGGEEGLRGALGRQGARFLCLSLVPFDVAVRRGGGGARCGAAGPAGCSGPPQSVGPAGLRRGNERFYLCRGDPVSPSTGVGNGSGHPSRGHPADVLRGWTAGGTVGTWRPLRAAGSRFCSLGCSLQECHIHFHWVL